LIFHQSLLFVARWLKNILLNITAKVDFSKFFFVIFYVFFDSAFDFQRQRYYFEKVS